MSTSLSGVEATAGKEVPSRGRGSTVRLGSVVIIVPLVSAVWFDPGLMGDKTEQVGSVHSGKR